MSPASVHPALHGWTAALAALAADVVVGLAPMVRRLDELVGRHPTVEGPEGEVDGRSGLTTRGRPEHLLASQWALADALPEEFLRRAASRELLHVATARRQDQRTGTTRLVVDAGPAQAGAARLVQLAALVVLHRRAADRGARFEVGVLGEDPEVWHDGDLPHLLRRWLSARRDEDATPDQVLARASGAGPVWFVLPPALRAALPAGLGAGRVITVREDGWGADGVVGVEVTLAGERVHLPVPPAPVSVRVLRGEGFRPARHHADGAQDGAARVRAAAFAGPYLLGRGDDDRTVRVAYLGDEPKRERSREVSTRGVVLAAVAMPRRVVVLHQHADGVEVRVHGRSLRSWGGVVLPVEVAGVPVPDLAATGAGPLWPAHHDNGALLVRLPSGWHHLADDGRVAPVPSLLDVAPHDAGNVRLLSRVGDNLLHAAGRVDGVPRDAVVRWGGGWVAWTTDLAHWRLAGPRGARAEVRTSAQDAVVGVVAAPAGPRLVARSGAGLLVRLVGPDGATTPRRLRADLPQRVVVHPGLPLVARDAGGGTVVVDDVTTDRTIATVPGSLA